MGWLQNRRDRREQEARDARQRHKDEEERFYRYYRHSRAEFIEGELSERDFLTVFRMFILRQDAVPIVDSVLYIAREYHAVMTERYENAQ